MSFVPGASFYAFGNTYLLIKLEKTGETQENKQQQQETMKQNLQGNRTERLQNMAGGL